MRNTIITLLATGIISGCNPPQENLLLIEQNGKIACQKVKDILIHGTNPPREFDEITGSNHQKGVVWTTFGENREVRISIGGDIGGFIPYPERKIKDGTKDKIGTIIGSSKFIGCYFHGGKVIPLHEGDFSINAKGNIKLNIS